LLLSAGPTEAAPQIAGPHDAKAARAAGRAKTFAAQSFTTQQVPTDPNAAELQRKFVTYRVFATQYVPNPDTSIEVSVPDRCVKATVLKTSNPMCSSGYSPNGDYRVLIVMDNGSSFILPVKEVGPWNLDDNYWDLPSGPRPRRLFGDLPRGKPEAQAAYEEDYNKQANCKQLDTRTAYDPPRTDGADQYGRCVLNSSAIDVSVPAAKQYGFPGSSWVTATFLWEPSTALSKPLVFREGMWYLRDVLSNGPSQAAFQFGQRGDIPVTGDWDGNGTKTVGIFRPSEGRWYLRNSNSGGPPDAGSFLYGSPGDDPVVGDWNGDGTDTLGVFRAREGMWYLTNNNNSGFAEGAFRYGNPSGDVPVVGDWNRDGGDSIGVFRTSEGKWYLTNNYASGIPEGVFRYGSPGDKPVPGDWDGDGNTSLGIFRANEGRWYVTNMLDGAVSQFSFLFGSPTDVPKTWN
jgi:hypothetical protein